MATRPLALQRFTADGLQFASYFYSFDQVKNVTELFDSTGTLAATYDYSPFGAVTTSSGPAAALNPLTFSSEVNDTALGLVCYNYRYLNFLDGRWLNRDPIAERGGVNLYCYINNMSVLTYDNLGLVYKVPEWLGDSCIDGTRKIQWCKDQLALLDAAASNIIKKLKDPNTTEEAKAGFKLIWGTVMATRSIIADQLSALTVKAASGVTLTGSCCAFGVGVIIGTGLNQIPEVEQGAQWIFWPITDWLVEHEWYGF